MFEFIKNFFRIKALKKYSSSIPTGILPLNKVKTAIAILNVEDSYFEECKERINKFFRENHIKGEIYFLDFRKIGKEEILITSIKSTILRKDLNWFGRISKEQIKSLQENNYNLLISLIDNDEFPIKFISKVANANFKIGRKYLDGCTFDIILNDKPNEKSTSIDIFNEMLNYLNIIE